LRAHGSDAAHGHLVELAIRAVQAIASRSAATFASVMALVSATAAFSKASLIVAPVPSTPISASWGK
jgi:hypothetical protein